MPTVCRRQSWPTDQEQNNKSYRQSVRTYVTIHYYFYLLCLVIQSGKALLSTSFWRSDDRSNEFQTVSDDRSSETVWRSDDRSSETVWRSDDRSSETFWRGDDRSYERQTGLFFRWSINGKKCRSEERSSPRQTVSDDRSSEREINSFERSSPRQNDVDSRASPDCNGALLRKFLTHH